MYNKDALETLAIRIKYLGSVLEEFSPEDTLDLYSYIASIIYNRPYEECCEIPDGIANPEGKYLRNKAKEFIFPIITECGGLFDEVNSDDSKRT